LKRFFLLLLAVVLAAPAWAQRGAMTVPRNLSQLTDRSAYIVRGNVVSAHVEKHPEFTNLDTVVVTLRVKETLKGETGNTFTFRQFIWDIRDRSDGAGYQKGQDLLLMMIAPNQHGLSSPAGLQQGRFRILRDKTGKEFAVNGQSNFKLFEGMGTELARKGITLSAKSSALVAKHRSGPVAVGDLTGLIRELTKESN
jgi:hypothetical protein